ncbi:MAG: histidine phosphatase family protein [Roseimicrobium sp.]
MSTLRIHLIRHGQTAWSITGQHTGTTDIPLTALGEDEARRLGVRLRGLEFSHVFTSPRWRARQTCELVGLNAEPLVHPDLAEWDYGAYEGQTPAEICAIRPSWNIFQDGAPQGESPEQVALRVNRLIAMLGKLTGNVALFTHGHLGRVIGARWIHLTVEHGRNFLLNTASVSILSYEHGRVEQPAIEQWNTCE